MPRSCTQNHTLVGTPAEPSIFDDGVPAEVLSFDPVAMSIPFPAPFRGRRPTGGLLYIGIPAAGKGECTHPVTYDLFAYPHVAPLPD